MNPARNSNLAMNASSQTLSEYVCLNSIFTWVLSDTTLFKVAAIITSIACPATIVFNILVIIAVMERRGLQRHSTSILLASMAIGDALVGVVSMPLTITLDVLVLLKDVNANSSERFLSNSVREFSDIIYCSLSVFVPFDIDCMGEICGRCMDFKVIVTRRRTVILSAIAWMLVVVIQIPSRIMLRPWVEHKYILFINIGSLFPAGLCIILIGYFYVKAYLFTRKRRVEEINQVHTLIKVKLERKIANTAIVTAALLISFVPSLIRIVFGNVFPALHNTSYFRWAQMLVQLSSLFNPVLYCYRDRRFRNAWLEMLKIRKPKVKKPKADFLEVNIRRVGSVVLSGNLREPQDGERQARITRSKIRSSVQCGEKISKEKPD